MTTSAPVTRPRFVFPTTRRGWLAVVGVALLLGVAMIVENGTYPQRNGLSPLIFLSIVLIMACAVLAYPLPFLGLVVAVGLCTANVLVPGMPHGGGTELIMLLFMIGFFAFRLPGRWSLAAWLVVAASVGVSTAVRGGEVFEILFYLLFTAPGWFVGSLLQREKLRSAELSRLAAELAAERELRTQTAISAERARIARELHDAVAHSVSVMTLQVGVVRRRLDGMTAEQDTLRQAEQLGRRSVDELHRIVGLVRAEGPDLAPVPSLAQVEELVAQVRLAGTAVTLERTGEVRDLGQALDVSAYRIVQEGLTNAIKHAPGATIAVQLDAGQQQLAITVRDDGPATGVATAGNGLTGMAERVAMFGGTLHYGAAEPRGFAVRVVLPLRARVEEPVR
ncbi:histidine kinase [uncultured Friedmanniella sp.]|uniref:sensor histidine kinase n=1 Tax=uncultured Friedmanniella sp. TaxID=335381 RepID=UPI0035CC2821